MSNPYQPPTAVDDATDGAAEFAEVRRRLSRPATALIIMASIHAVFPAIGIVGMLVIASRGELGGGAIPPLIGMTIQFIISVSIAIGAAKMGHLESYRAGRTAAILSCIPGLSPFGVLGIPFGIWSIRLLNDPAVQAAFPDGPRSLATGSEPSAAAELDAAIARLPAKVPTRVLPSRRRK